MALSDIQSLKCFTFWYCFSGRYTGMAPPDAAAHWQRRVGHRADKGDSWDAAGRGPRTPEGKTPC